MYDRITQRQLLLFVEIIKQGSVAGAADALSITQSAASKSLGQLEQVVGERLLERNRAGILLTPAGEIFHRYASASLTAVRQGMELIAQSRKDARHAVLLGSLPNVASEVLPAAVAAFKTRHQDVPVKIITDTNRNLLTLLRTAEVDFVVGRFAEPADMMGLHFERLYYETLALVARPGHPLLSPAPLSLRDITDYAVILPPPGTVIRPEIDRFFLSRGLIELPNTIETLSVEFGRHYALQNDALWITARGILRPDIEAGVLQELAVDLTATESAVGISTRAEAGLTRLSAELIEQLRIASRLIKP
ncbi:pca operon transcription factor PcaQ [Marinobacterium nitratireducens]|uniref:Pca operon transcription factor PcaQ n=1 Tax=Marinobacterium nitratireducens TaxID=518897 RepID=A0A917ZDJ3_9GAMM|nr:pca operon transcription factor PcaQ [Marinobacterium nitratireducens]GGO79954.1 pca operon transcription factor PcaQ [Marinobacterium nitratireducens]